VKAIGYARLSTGKRERGLTLKRQHEKISAYCRLHDLDLVGIADDGKGTKNPRGSGIQEVLRTAKEKKVDAVVVYRLDRIFESAGDALETSRLLDDLGISFHSIQEQVDTRGPMGDFYFTLLESIAQLDQRAPSEGVADGRPVQRTGDGETPDPVPYGYHWVDGELVKHPGEQGVVNKIAMLRKKGRTSSQIALRLNDTRSRARGGRKWQAQTVDDAVASSREHLKKIIGVLNRGPVEK